MDIDVTRKIGFDEFIERFRIRLAQGWNGFSGEADILPTVDKAIDWVNVLIARIDAAGE